MKKQSLLLMLALLLGLLVACGGGEVDTEALDAANEAAAAADEYKVIN
ncbi:MAG: hypothetical protein KDE04_14865 [Anaerolineales bacterium]|nr:hypothetical protein [Anaerolineales bacterium]MCB0012158.1 hypothetical protein [Anaerolineales bacterium]MCB8960245.1 hypothetical protein [Ardenticatenales bacterium]